MKCKCGAKLIKIRKLTEDNTFETFFIHPETLDRCEVSADGVSLEIVDRRLLNAFQERIKTSFKDKIMRLFK